VGEVIGDSGCGGSWSIVRQPLNFVTAFGT